MFVDILAIGSHPDDCEIFMGGSLLFFKQLGLKIGICDLSKGELSTYGSATTRKQELQLASQMLQLDFRSCLDLPDGFIIPSAEACAKIVAVIRSTKPTLVFTWAKNVRHPDHKNAHHIVKEACFKAGLEKWNISLGQAHQPQGIGFFSDLHTFVADFVIDISPFYEQKKQLIQCYSSQVQTDPQQISSKTFLKSSHFWKVLEAQNVLAGQSIGVSFGEPFLWSTPIRVTDPLQQLGNLFAS